MKSIIHKALRKRGKQIVDYPDDALKMRRVIMDNHKIDTILDVGANTGQYGLLMRELGYTGKLISFEPMKKAFQELENNAKSDSSWITINHALGHKDGRSVINISNNSFSSSILEMLPTHENSAPTSKYVAKEEIEIKKLDSVFDSVCPKGSNVMLKIDTQGYEKNVLDGSTESLKNIGVIELELSLVPLYENGSLYLEMIELLNGKGFDLFYLENVFSNPDTGQLLQVDGIFVRRE